MNDIFWIINIFLSVCCVADIAVVMKRDLMMLQQNSYRNERYVKWFNHSNESTNPWRLAACIALFLLLVNHLPHLLSAFLAAFILFFNLIFYIRKKYKKPLVFTSRALRIYILTLILGLSAPIVLGICLKSLYLANEIGILVIVLSPLFLIISNLILLPFEKINNRRYYKDAQRLLQSHPELIIIGITGSYGKTSTKHFLYHLLSQKYETLMTPGSYNTLLGVVRTIRESLKPYHQVFIVEMGAKQTGDIKEICDLVHPHIGIVTSIGEQHLETFRNVETVLKTKFELIESLPQNGLAVINSSNPIVKSIEVSSVPTVYYGTNSGFDRLKILNSTSYGTHCQFTNKENELIDFETPLLGSANIENLTASLIVSDYLNLKPKEIKYACSTMPQVEHRLQIIHAKTGFTIIDDAFNSNPVGAKMALDVLKSISTNGKKIVVTPGMIELGEVQYEKNRDFGRQIGDNADFAIIVGEYNKDSLLEGLALSSIDKQNVYAASDFTEAQKIILEKVRKNDIILYENDLPDTFR